MSKAQPPDPTALTATAAAEAIRNGEITSEALVAACLARIAEREPEVQAWANLDPEGAMAQAQAADELRASGKATGPLNGVPIGVKDIFDAADFPTEHGCPIFAGRRPEQDAAAIALLRAAGAVILGKTMTTELALLTPAKTRNPVNHAHTPGGSSAGSAAAVAAGMVPAALGSQTAGSVIRPASFCGVYGFKPTLGLIPRSGVLMQSHTLDTVGVFGRSVDDLAILADCMTGHDPNDSVSFRSLGLKLADAARLPAPVALRLAFVRTPAWGDADPAMHAAFAGLITDLGDSVTEVELPVLADVMAWQATVQLAENAYYYGPLLRQAPDKLSDGLKVRLEAGLRIDTQAYIAALASRETAYREVLHVLDRFDAILTPAAPGPAPAGFATTGNPIFNGLWTYLGMPAVALPLLEGGGLPIGVQLVGARRDDSHLLRTAHALEAQLETAA